MMEPKLAPTTGIHPPPRAVPLFSDFPPHPNRGRGGVSEQNVVLAATWGGGPGLNYRR